jgi:hypothetical protein
MRESAHFQINDIQVVHETFDDEILAINLDTGTYYSMAGLSAQVWRWVIAGSPLGAIGRALSKACGVSPELIAVQLEDFVQKLEQDRLILPSDAPAAEEAPMFSTPHGKVAVALAFDVYTDMQDLLLLDPIHDVDEAGWPLAKSARRTTAE